MASVSAIRRGFLRSVASTAGVVLGLASLSGCYLDNSGQDPNPTQLYYPTALVVSPGRSALYVANSDFDLQFNGGTVVAYDLAKLRGRVIAPLLAGLTAGKGSDACAAVALGDLGQPVSDGNPDGHLLPSSKTDSAEGSSLLSPGPCTPVVSSGLVAQFATTGAFASGAAIGLRSDGTPGARLFVTVRGDPSLTWFDVVDDRDPAKLQSPCGSDICLSCGESGPLAKCRDTHRAGVDPTLSQRGITMPTEPVGVSIDEEGTAIVIANQTTSTASLVVNRWDDPLGPQLEFSLGGLASGPTEVATVPVPAVVRALAKADGGTCSSFAYDPGFLVTFRGAAEIDLLRYHPDCAASPSRPFLTRAYAVGISTNSSGADSRGIAIDATERRACERACADGDVACLTACLAIPMPFYSANRKPASLLVGEVKTELAFTNGVPTGAFDTFRVDDQVPLAAGPSRVVLGDVIGTDGARHRRVFTAAFDSRLVFDYDPTDRRIEAVIRTGRGPQSLAFDTGDDGDGLHSYLYVGHFTDSYVGAVDLDQRHGGTFGTMFATIGVPLPPKDSK